MKTAFITGGASGLGLATARNFVAAGANVMLFDLNTESLEQAAEEFGAQSIWQAGDVADESAVASAIATTKEKFYHLFLQILPCLRVYH